MHKVHFFFVLDIYIRIGENFAFATFSKSRKQTQFIVLERNLIKKSRMLHEMEIHRKTKITMIFSNIVFIFKNCFT